MFTSETFSRPFPGRADITWWLSLLGQAPHEPLPPDTVLRGDSRPGHCWPFRGSYGLLAIDLREEVIIKNVTVGHLRDGGTRGHTFAPRQIVVWGLLPLTSTAGSETYGPEIEVEDASPGSGGPQELAIAHDYKLTKLTSIRYDVHATEREQTFFVGSRTSNTTRFDKILVEVLDNWGSKTYTCMYHIRIRGFV
ncbi:hypothetical protein C8Q76DRAFT_625571 [Earliella scabrosa]|nr:hypothetical protein C8Q76DRAFT_625571 [Earliella scabrosa]